jgi:lysozyme
VASSISLNTFITPSDLGLTPTATSGQSSSNAASSWVKELEEGIELIKLWEGLELEAYPDPATKGPPITIGYGCTRKNDGSAIHLGERITEAEAEAMLNHQLERDYLPALQKIPFWNEMFPYQKGALLSYAWNIGVGFVGDTDNFATINRVLSNKNWADVPDAFMLYVRGGGKVMLGLKRRRFSEACLWEGKHAHEAYERGIAVVA